MSKTFFEKIEQIVTIGQLYDMEGAYHFGNHGEYIIHEEQKYMYYKTGSCRKVFVSPCGNFVIKVPKTNQTITKQDINYLLLNPHKNQPILDISVVHNIYEALCYELANEHQRQFMAHTELLPNCWVKQEKVKVIRCYDSHNLREIGIKHGKYVLFDFDYMLNDLHVMPQNGYDYDKLERKIKQLTDLYPLINK